MGADPTRAAPCPPPRVVPGGREDVGLVNLLVSRAAGLAGGTGPPNLFLTLGRHRRLFRAWLVFAGRLMPRGRLPRRETELAILRVAHLRSCAYELDHHVELGRRAGITTADVVRVLAGPDAAGWSGRERSLLALVDALHHGEVGDATWDAFRADHDEADAIELCLLVGHYEMLATVIDALRIGPDERRPPRRHRR